MTIFTNRNIKRKIILSLLISIFFLIWIFPVSSDGLGDVIKKSGSLDGSWRIGLNWATIKDLNFGDDIIFTYGPLYFLSANSLVAINRTLYFAANILSLFLWFISLFLIILFVIEKISFQDLKSKIFSLLIIIFGLYALLNIYLELPEILLLLIIILLFNVLKESSMDSKKMLWIVFTGLILAIISLVKFYYILVSLILVLISIIFFLYLKKPLGSLIIFGSYFSFLIIIWILLEKSLVTLPLYIKNGSFITFGYSENVQSFFEGWQDFLIEGRLILLYAIFIFLCWIGLFIFAIVKKERNLVLFLTITFPILFLVYKHGFTRMDFYHTQEYFRFIIIFLIVTLVICGKKLWKIFPIFLVLILIALPFRTANETLSIRQRILYNLNEGRKAINIIIPERFETIKHEDIKNIKNNFGIYNDVVQKIKYVDTVDIFPFEIVIPYIYNLNWNPRPIFQSYTVYNEQLNKINASHFEGEKSPTKVIYSLYSIDGRYPIFDEPLVFQNLLKNYKFTYTNSSGIGLLEKKKVVTDYEIKEIKKIVSNFNKKIPIPQEDDGYVFCKINIKLNIFGRIKNFFYKGGYIGINFYLDESNEGPIWYRILRENGKLGFFVSSYIRNIDELKDVFNAQYNGKKINNIKYIELTTNDNYSYNKNFQVEFYKILYH